MPLARPIHVYPRTPITLGQLRSLPVICMHMSFRRCFSLVMASARWYWCNIPVVRDGIRLWCGRQLAWHCSLQQQDPWSYGHCDRWTYRCTVVYDCSKYTWIDSREVEAAALCTLKEEVSVHQLKRLRSISSILGTSPTMKSAGDKGCRRTVVSHWLESK